MRFHEFVTYVKDHVLEGWAGGPYVTVDVKEVVKNNDTICVGINISEPGQRIVPTLYLEPYYEAYLDEMSLDLILSSIRRNYLEAMENMPFNVVDLPDVTDYEAIKDQIIFQLVNYEKNHKRIEEGPYLVKDDLAVVFRILFEMKDEACASCLITNEMAQEWQMDAQDLLKVARKNTQRIYPKRFVNLMELLFLMSDGMYSAEEEIPMYVLTNEQGMNGASCILYEGTLEECSRELGGNFYVLPSSLHECILVPEHCVDEPKYLLEMVREVNASGVEPEDVLSDSVYFYDTAQKDLTLLK